MIFYACNCLGQLKTSEKNFAEQMKIRKEIMCSEQLKKVFENFKFPQWHWKLKTQIYLMKYKMKYLYAMFIG